MNKTIKLFYDNAYDTTFTATVVSCTKTEKNGETLFETILDKTLFFPEEGGQTPDKGVIEFNDLKFDVVDVQIKDDIIYHYTKEPVSEGAKVCGTIDFQHRFYNMQQHSGEHIFSGLVHSKFGYDNVGFHLSDQTVTMDYNGVLTEKDIYELEYQVNKAITDNVEISTKIYSKEEIKDLVYRSKLDLQKDIRIVTIPGYDVCACCAPHVKRTGEIGIFKIMSFQNHRGGVRINYLCGFRALDAFNEKSGIISALIGLFTTSADQLISSVEKLKDENKDLKLSLSKAKQSLLINKLKEIPCEQQNILLFENDLDQVAMKLTINEAVRTRTGYCAVFNGNDTKGYNFLIGSRECNCQEIAAMLRSTLSAKCGGAKDMIQGSVTASRKDIEDILK